jgi:hypothetical protein
MMIPVRTRLCALAALLAAAGSPALAESPSGQPATGARAPVSGARSEPAERSRRVELPFPLESHATDGKPRAPAAKQGDGPHPYREIRFQRASLDQAGAGPRGHGLRGLSHSAKLG